MSAPSPAVGVILALIALGTALALGAQLLLATIPIPLLRDLRTPLGAVILVAPLAVALRGNVAMFGFHRERLGLALTVGLVLSLATITLFGKWTAIGPTPGQIGALAAFGVVAAVEEGIFRGVLQTQLVSRLGLWLGLIATAVAFTIWHIPLRVVMGSSGADLALGLVPVFLAGIVFGVLMAMIRNAAAPAILHTAVNWVERL